MYVVLWLMEAFRTVTGKGKRRSSMECRPTDQWFLYTVRTPLYYNAHSGTGLHTSDGVKGDELISSRTEQYAW